MQHEWLRLHTADNRVVALRDLLARHLLKAGDATFARLMKANLCTRAPSPLSNLIGGGSFSRAFVNWMIDVLNEQTDFNGGVVIVKPTSRVDYEELKKQEGLFTLALRIP